MTESGLEGVKELCFASLAEAYPDIEASRLAAASDLLAAFVVDTTPPEQVGRMSLEIAQRLQDLLEGGSLATPDPNRSAPPVGALAGTST